MGALASRDDNWSNTDPRPLLEPIEKQKYCAECLCFKELPLVILKQFFPSSYQSLRRMGYEDVLRIKGLTHLSLWLSFIISLVFVSLWFSDLFSLNCLSRAGASNWENKSRCFFEAVGLVIFLASLKDFMSMICHYDTEKQLVLKGRKAALESLTYETKEALQKMENIIQWLQDKVNSQMKEKVEDYTREVFGILMPNIREGLRQPRILAGDVPSATETPAQRGALEKLEKELLEELKDVLVDVEQLSFSMLTALAEKDVEVYEKVYERNEHINNEPQVAQKWDELCEIWPKSGVADSTAKSQDLASQLSEKVFHPITKIIPGVPAQFQRMREAIRDQFERTSSRNGILKDRPRSVSFKKPSSEGACKCFRCCVPRGFGIFFKVASACCNAAHTGEGSSGKIEDLTLKLSGRGFEYPKVFGVGWLLIRIYSKQHERLIQLVFFSVVYWFMYVYQFVDMVKHFEELCPNIFGKVLFERHFSSGQCVLQIGRKLGGVLALLAYIPAMCVCLYRVDRLDAVLATMETIWELEDIHKAAVAFNWRMDRVGEEVALAKAVQDRVLLTRIALVNKFSRYMEFEKNKWSQQEFENKTEGLVNWLRDAKERLGEARLWYSTDERTGVIQRKIIENVQKSVKTNIEELTRQSDTRNPQFQADGFRFSFVEELPEMDPASFGDLPTFPTGTFQSDGSKKASVARQSLFQRCCSQENVKIWVCALACMFPVTLGLAYAIKHHCELEENLKYSGVQDAMPSIVMEYLTKALKYLTKVLKLGKCPPSKS